MNQKGTAMEFKMTDKKTEITCPDCGEKKLKVFFMNYSCYNDYYCYGCGNIFKFNKGKNRYFRITKQRFKVLQEVLKRHWGDLVQPRRHGEP